MTTKAGTILLSHRAARGSASRALRVAGIRAEYRSADALRFDGDSDPRPTPRYHFTCTPAQYERLCDALLADGFGCDLYAN